MQIAVEVEIEFKEGKKTIEMLLKEKHEIENCEIGKAVVINRRNGEVLTGIFKGMDIDDVMLGSLDTCHTIGLKVKSISDYLEEVSISNRK